MLKRYVVARTARVTHYMREYIAKCIWPAEAELGEGPLWFAEQQRFYFVDIKSKTLHAIDALTGARHKWTMPDYICWIVARRDGDGFMIGLRNSIGRLWLEPEVRIELLDLGIELESAVRFNDAKVDQFGSLWVGSMHNLDYGCAVGRLFRISGSLDVSVAERDMHICNGPAFSSDGTTMYHTDTFLGQVYSYSFDATGINAPRGLWRQFDTAIEGGPDGMCTDSEGGLWIAQWGGSRVCRYQPDGTLSAIVRLPVSHVSSCTFGGPDLDTLFITSARQELTPMQLAKEPLAGGIFAVKTDFIGVPTYPFG